MTEVWTALEAWAVRLERRRSFLREAVEAHGTVRFLCARGEGK